jgi:hypothetical protein
MANLVSFERALKASKRCSRSIPCILVFAMADISSVSKIRKQYIFDYFKYIDYYIIIILMSRV